jgi:hypothetical protein
MTKGLTNTRAYGTPELNYQGGVAGYAGPARESDKTGPATEIFKSPPRQTHSQEPTVANDDGQEAIQSALRKAERQKNRCNTEATS